MRTKLKFELNDRVYYHSVLIKREHLITGRICDISDISVNNQLDLEIRYAVFWDTGCVTSGLTECDLLFADDFREMIWQATHEAEV